MQRYRYWLVETGSQARAFLLPALSVIFMLWPTPSLAAGPTVSFSLPAENAMPSPLGSIPLPSDLYFDQGQKGDGDGTLLNSGTNLGVDAIAFNSNFIPAIERGLDVMDGWSVSAGCYFFFGSAIDGASLPTSPVLSPSTADSVFFMNLADGTLLPVRVVDDVDTRLANTLAVVPVAGTVLRANTSYACVVTTTVQGGGQPVVPSADFVAARDRTSPNTDANDIYGAAADTVVANGGGLLRSEIAGMAVFTTQDPNADLVAIQTAVLPGLPMPAADFTLTANDFVFDSQAKLDALLGPAVSHANISVLATGYFDSPRFQTVDPDGNGKTEDLPNLTNLAQPCLVACEPDDEIFVDIAPADGLPDIQLTPRIPFTVVVPNVASPPSGYPIIINQHGLGGERELVALFADTLAEAGFASIGIDAVAHGYRYHDPEGISVLNGNGADGASNFFGGTVAPDGFADFGFFGLPLAAVTTQLGFFNGFTNLVGTRDNFRQTCVDLMQLVRLIQSGSIDTALGVNIDETNIFYVGHSLGGIMGSCLAAFEPDIKAFVLNAAGGGLLNQLLLNSSIGAGALDSLQRIYGLDRANVLDGVSLFASLGQTLLDAGDPITKAPHWIADPLVGGPRNLMLIVDHQDEVVPNQANEALAHAAELELFQPFVANPLVNPFAFPLVSTVGTVSANGPAGVTAFALQQGPAAHAATLGIAAISSLNFVPGHALVDEWGANGSTAFPVLERSVRIRNESSLPAVLEWFSDIVAGGTPGTFSFSPTQVPNPRENAPLAGGAESVVFFDRPVNGIPSSDATADVSVLMNSNDTAGRLTAARSILGTTSVGNNSDMPPGAVLLSSGALPFFVSLVKKPQGNFNADLSVSYGAADLDAAGIADGSADESGLMLARMGGPGTCAMAANACVDQNDCSSGEPCVELLSSSVDTATNTVTASGLTEFSTFAVLSPTAFTPALRIQGGGSTKKDCAVEWLVQNPGASGLVDKKGRQLTKQSCTQGDLSCDFDSDPGQCTFRVGECFRVQDPVLPRCLLTSSGKSLTVASYSVKKPSEKDVLNPKKPKAGVNRAALVDVVADVLQLPQTETDSCAAFEIVVPLKKGVKRGKAVLKILAEGTLGPKRVKDADKLKLFCEP
ncbi:MAG: hypothetical protein ACE5E4_06085 [Candidatus Binatia bacterium]